MSDVKILHLLGFLTPSSLGYVPRLGSQMHADTCNKYQKTDNIYASLYNNNEGISDTMPYFFKPLPMSQY